MLDELWINSLITDVAPLVEKQSVAGCLLGSVGERGVRMRARVVGMQPEHEGRETWGAGSTGAALLCSHWAEVGGTE